MAFSSDYFNNENDVCEMKVFTIFLADRFLAQLGRGEPGRGEKGGSRFELDTLKPRSLWFYDPKMSFGCFGCEHHPFLWSAHRARNCRFVATFESVGDVVKSFSRIPSTRFSKNHLAIRGHTCACHPVLKGFASEPQVICSILGGGIQRKLLKIHPTSSTQRRDWACQIQLLSFVKFTISDSNTDS